MLLLVPTVFRVYAAAAELNMLSGVAAILKFPIDDILEQDDRGDENSKREC